MRFERHLRSLLFSGIQPKSDHTLFANSKKVVEGKDKKPDSKKNLRATEIDLFTVNKPDPSKQELTKNDSKTRLKDDDLKGHDI